MNNLAEQTRYRLVAHYILDKLQGLSDPAIACSKLAVKTLEQGVKYVQS